MKPISIVRLFARIVATPIFVIAFGVMWVGFVLLIGVMLQVFSFLADERFNWKEHLKDCNEFFCEPLKEMWQRKVKS